LEASAPNQVWSWDISKLPLETRGVFLNLYVVLDLFSRFVVAWMVALRENSALAKQLFTDALSRYGVTPGSLIVHMDRGAPMTSHGFTDLHSELGVERSHSVPARLPRPLPRHQTRPPLVRRLLSLVQP
jgi:putative transposase